MKRLFVVDVTGYSYTAVLEHDLDKVCKDKYDMEKIRIERPLGRFELVSLFPEKIQYCKRLSWIQAIILMFKIGYSLRHNLFVNHIKCGWAIE